MVIAKPGHKRAPHWHPRGCRIPETACFATCHHLRSHPGLYKSWCHCPHCLSIPEGLKEQLQRMRQSFYGPKDSSGAKPGPSDKELLHCQKLKFWNFLMQSQFQIFSLFFYSPHPPCKKNENSNILASTLTHLPNDFLHLEAAQCLITSVRPCHNAWF